MGAGEREDRPAVGEVTPPPTDEEVAAIVAAVDAAWPHTVVAAGAGSRRPPAWRFSGRWWARPVPARRDRPWW